MEGMEDKLGAILSNPQMMQQIMSMAQALGASENHAPAQEAPKQESAPSPIPGLDPGMLQKLAGLAGQSGIDRNQQALLKALGPYLSRGRIDKLEKAMRAAKMAGMAAVFLNQGGSHILSGR